MLHLGTVLHTDLERCAASERAKEVQVASSGGEGALAFLAHPSISPAHQPPLMSVFAWSV